MMCDWVNTFLKKKKKDFAPNLRKFGIACSEKEEVNEWIALDILTLNSQSECVKNTVHCFSIY